MHSILIIGGGNMGGALAMRWRKALKDASIALVEPSAPKRARFTKHGIETHAQLTRYKGVPELVLLAVKPQSAEEVLKYLRNKRAHYRSALVVSIMAGVPLSRLSGIGQHAVRVMPNTPALIGEAMSVICAPSLPEKQRQALTALFGAAGAVAWVENEKDLHAVTAISGSGPAYLFAFMEALMQAGEALGLRKETAKLLVTQTMRGAALLADAHSGDVVTLRQAVTSPKGTTEAALKSFKKSKLERVVKHATKAAEKRSKKLSK